MILSNGQQLEAKQINDGLLIKEERVFFNQYKNSTQSTFSARNDSKFYSALENEIKAFNRWQDFVEELNNRNKAGKRK